MFAFDGFYVYSAELFPTVIRYSMARRNFYQKEMKQFASFLNRRRNGIMGSKALADPFFFVMDLWHQNLQFCSHFARHFTLQWTMRPFSVQLIGTQSAGAHAH